MKKSTIIKILCVMVTITLLIGSFAIQTGAVVDVRRDGAVFEVIHYNPEFPTSGVSEEELISNHVEATSILCEKITQITYAEILWFDINKLIVGLPYESVDEVANLDTVSSITLYEDTAISTKAPQDKLDTSIIEAMKTNPIDRVLNGVCVVLSYNAAVYYGFSEEDFADPQDYLIAKRKTNEIYHTQLNQKYFEEISEQVNAELSSMSKYTPYIFLNISIAEIEKLAQLPQVSSIGYQSEEPYDEPTETPDSTYKYKDKFNSFYKLTEYNCENPAIDEFYRTYSDYEELYEHSDENNNIDWALITAKVNAPSNPWEVVGVMKIGNKAIKWWQPGAGQHPFALFVYNADEEQFYDIEQIDLSEYDDLSKTIEDLSLGHTIGDVDMDSYISVMDATAIQMYLANMLDCKPYINPYEYIHMLGDFDNDNEMSVIDATKIQFMLAKLS